MREKLFRGKREDNDEWVRGCLVSIEAYDIKTTDEKTNQKVYCITNPYFPFEITVNDADNLELSLYRVIPETVGQYTGLTDKNGKKVFEGDILVLCKGATYPYQIIWDGMGWKLIRSDGKRIKEAFECNEMHYVNISEVIGNIHDNPELLKDGGSGE